MPPPTWSSRRSTITWHQSLLLLARLDHREFVVSLVLLDPRYRSFLEVAPFADLEIERASWDLQDSLALPDVQELQGFLDRWVSLARCEELIPVGQHSYLRYRSDLRASRDPLVLLEYLDSRVHPTPCCSSLCPLLPVLLC